MADDIQKKILISAETKLGSVREDLLELNGTLDDQLTKQRLLELQGKRNTEEYINIASQVRLTKQAIRDSNRELDNTVKALNASSNSITQNRALLSSLTTEYVRLSQSEGNTAASTLKLKADIDTLTVSLRNQEKAIGITKTSVGDYENSIKRALSSLTGSIPGFQQYGAAAESVVKVVGGFLPQAITKAGNAFNSFVGNPGRNVVQGFGTMKQSTASAVEEIETVAPAAAEAEAGLAGMAPATEAAAGGLGAVTAGSVATGGAIAALVGIIAGAIYWFQSLGSVGEKSAQVFNGVKASALAFFNDLQKGDMKNFANDMETAYNQGVQLKKGMQALERTQQQSDITVAQYDRQIAANMLELRYRKISLEDAKRIDKETEKLETARVDRKIKNYGIEYELSVESATNGKKLSQEEKDRFQDVIRTGNLAEIQWLERKDKINKGTAQSIHDIELNIIAARAEADQSEQKTINRQAIIEQRFGKAAAKFQQAQTNELAQANANIRQAEETKLESMSRQLEFTYSAYGKELAATDAHYQAMIFKQMQFVAQQEKLSKLAKSPAASKKFLEARDKGLAAIDQMQKEWDQAIKKAIDDNNEKINTALLKSADELHQASIANIKDAEQRQIETLRLQEQIRTEDYNQKKSDREKEIDELKKQADKAGEDEKGSLLGRVDVLLKIQQNADNQLVLEAQKTAEEIKLVKQKAAQQEAINLDKIKVSQAEMANGGDANEKELEAKKQLLADEAIAEMNQENITDSQKLLIYQQYLEKVKQLDDQYNEKKKQEQLKLAQQIETSAFTILQQSLQRQQQANEVYMERQKNFDLQNQALTQTQRYEVSEKYRVLEGKAKVKAFNQQKEISIAEALVNGALAIGKAYAEEGPIVASAELPFLIAETAIQVATIAAQKPPAYAVGGVHFVSDGSGSLLRGPGNETSDSMNARLSNGEAIINAKSTSMFGPLLSAINQAGGGRAFQSSPTGLSPFFTPGFASGGVYLPTADNGLRPQQLVGSMGPSRIHTDDMNTLIAGISNTMMNSIKTIPAPVVDVKDINRQQGKLSVTDNRGNY